MNMWRGLPAVAILSAGLCPAADKAEPEPRIASLYPSCVQPGAPVQLTVRGTALDEPKALVFSRAGFEGTILENSSEAPPEGSKSKTPIFRVIARVHAAASSTLEPVQVRLVSAAGVSNPLPLCIADRPVQDESAAQGRISTQPETISGLISAPGEVDGYWIEAAAGDTVTFEASGSGGLDASVAIYEQTGSWFDPERMNLVARNDEPLSFPGLANNARLVHTFAHPGKYKVTVQGFAGQGGPDCVYALKVTPNVTAPPELHPQLIPGWDERKFTRALSPGWLTAVAQRGGMPSQDALTAAAQVSSPLSPPALIEGRLSRPSEVHVVQWKVEKPGPYAIEIETPADTMPLFDPVVRLLDASGDELVTNVYTKRNNNGLNMMKMIHPKVTFSLGAAGVYRMEIRDITTDHVAENARYRVLLRPQFPHPGAFASQPEQVNLRSGEGKALSFTFDREENFTGFIAFTVEGLPPGVQAVTAAAQPDDKPPLPNAGRRERYYPNPQDASVMLIASGDAAATPLPVTIRVIARPVVGGTLGEPVFVREIPLMVLPGRKS